MPRDARYCGLSRRMHTLVAHDAAAPGSCTRPARTRRNVPSKLRPRRNMEKPKHQPDSYDTNTTQHSGLLAPDQARSDTSKELMIRLQRYKRRLSKVNTLKAARQVVDTIIPIHFNPQNRFSVLEYEAQREDLTQEIKDLVEQIIRMEKRWFNSLCTAHKSAETHLDDDQELFQKHTKQATNLLEKTKKRNRLLERKRTVQGWSLSTIKGKELQRLDKEIAKVPDVEAPKGLFGNDYFEGLRRYLRGAGFIAAPSYLPPAAVFPRQDWILSASLPSHESLAEEADRLMKKYRLLGSPYAGLLYDTATSQKKCKCVCISWVQVVSATDNERVFVPVLGMSGGAPDRASTAESVEAMLGACALPPYQSMQGKQGALGFQSAPTTIPKPQVANQKVSFNQYYDDIMARANNLALNYRVRELLNLRLPSRQAMLSYLGLSFFPVKSADLDKLSEVITPTHAVALWHSLNCAEPAALAWITSFFVDGQDVYLCCPYEAKDDPGAWGLKPKETCPWCATVEIAFRSLEKFANDDRKKWSRRYASSMATGRWEREITFARTFEGRQKDMESRKRLPRNRAELELAYSPAVNSNVAVLREIFREVGILEESNIRVGQPALWQAG